MEVVYMQNQNGAVTQFLYVGQWIPVRPTDKWATELNVFDTSQPPSGSTNNGQTV